MAAWISVVRNATAPAMPLNSTQRWHSRGTPNAGNTSSQRNRLSIDSDLSTAYTVR